MIPILCAKCLMRPVRGFTGRATLCGPCHAEQATVAAVGVKKRHGPAFQLPPGRQPRPKDTEGSWWMQQDGETVEQWRKRHQQKSESFAITSDQTAYDPQRSA